jgi:hypothetical protein
MVRLGRDRYGVAVYRHVQGWSATGGPQNLSLEELPALTDVGLFCGDVDEAAHSLLIERLGDAATFATGTDNVRRPAALAELGWSRLQAGRIDDLVALEPLYLGSPVKEPKTANQELGTKTKE